MVVFWEKYMKTRRGFLGLNLSVEINWGYVVFFRAFVAC